MSLAPSAAHPSAPRRPEPMTLDSPELRPPSPRRVRRLASIQLLALLAVGMIIAAAGYLAGTTILRAQEREGRAQEHLLALVEGRDALRVEETRVWRSIVEGKNPVRAGLFTTFLAISSELTRIAKEERGDPNPTRDRAREEALSASASIGILLARAQIAGGRNVSEILVAMRGPKDKAARSIDAWVQANADLATVSRSQTRTSVYHSGILLVLLVVGLVGGGLVVRMVLLRMRSRADSDLRESAHRYRSLVRNSSDMVMIVDEDGIVQYASPAVERALQRPAVTLQSRPLTGVITRASTGALEGLLDHPDGTLIRPVEWQWTAADGTTMTVESRVTDQRRDPVIGGFILNSTDITDRKEAEAELEHRAFHDPLTDLANRALFIDRASNAIARLARHPGHVGVLLLDLDNFKTINDSLGHVVGDDLLVEVAGRVAGCLRPSDTAARLGGDEFALLVDGLGGQEAISALAERILEAIAKPMVIGGRTISTTASTGVAFTEDPATTPVELIRDADIAMYQAKRSGKGRVEVFETDMRNAVSRRMLLTTDLADAIERGALSVVYQPIVALEDARIVGMEALARWTHPELGPIAPDEFIPLAEEHGLIGALGNRVLHQACAEAAGWIDLCAGGRQPIYLTVNLSTRQLEQPMLAGEVVHALEESGLPPQLLTLEITESALMHDVEACARMMSGLKRIGLRVAIDDFGTGYSSLSSLARLPVDIVKIDRSFIAHMHDGGAAARLAGSIVQLSAALGLDTVAEGIERPDQAEALRDLGCGFGQGYLFSRPVPGDQVAGLITRPLDALTYSLADGVL